MLLVTLTSQAACPRSIVNARACVLCWRDFAVDSVVEIWGEQRYYLCNWKIVGEHADRLLFNIEIRASARLCHMQPTSGAHSSFILHYIFQVLGSSRQTPRRANLQEVCDEVHEDISQCHLPQQHESAEHTIIAALNSGCNKLMKMLVNR